MMTRLAALLALLLAANSAAAHFSPGTVIQSYVLDEGQDGLVAYLRLPAPFVFAGEIAAAAAEDRPLASPFLKVAADGGTRFISRGALRQDRNGAAALLEGVADWRQNNLPLDAELQDWRLLPMAEGPFDVGAAKAALAGPRTGADPGFGQAVFVIALRLSVPMPAATVGLRSGHPPLTLAEGVSVDTHLLDARLDPPLQRTVAGQLEGWVNFNGSRFAAASGFIWQGVVHILKGWDHVLLVVCLALGATSPRRLVWLVSAFTLGHAATLMASIFGAVPSWTWYIPAVEAAIAATVLYAAIAAWRQRLEAVWIMAAVGLLHGLGFAFVLQEILGRGPGMIPALAAFTFGIEAGQLAIVASVLALVAGLRRASRTWTALLRQAALVGIAALAGVWLVERVVVLV
ncbi:HupE/UreJ family protein [uncultured Jannaschia sp.]|uniref:HupE/UreJ family protein n=1 Tax=uncultured Jannaschia sp. TaxID=293347 RepID=UPI0026131B35|nr:HupE/UreJ family protein [uncultured Jannaschia sp.]